MPQGALTGIQGAIAVAIRQMQTVINDIQASQNLTTSAGADADKVVQTLLSAQAMVAGGSALDQSISTDTAALTNLAAQLTACQQQLSAAGVNPAGASVTPVTSTGLPSSLVPVGSPVGSTPLPTPGGAAQTYVSAPAVGALMAVSAILGAAGGYAGKSYLDGRKRSAAEETPHRVRARKSAKEMGDGK